MLKPGGDEFIMNVENQIKAVDHLTAIIRQFHGAPRLMPYGGLIKLFYARTLYAIKQVLATRGIGGVSVYLTSMADVPQRIIVWHPSFRLTILPPDRSIFIHLETVRLTNITGVLEALSPASFVNNPYSLLQKLDGRFEEWLTFQTELSKFEQKKYIPAFTD